MPLLETVALIGGFWLLASAVFFLLASALPDRRRPQPSAPELPEAITRAQPVHVDIRHLANDTAADANADLDRAA